MAKIVRHCPVEGCGKVQEVVSELKVGSLLIKTLKCKHTITELGVSGAAEDTLDITSLDGKKPFKFQLEGAAFAERANLRVLIADDMGLGKTVQAEILMAAHPECRPFVVFCKSGLRVQWNKESVRWGDFVCQVLDDTRTQLLPGFDGYIISLDSAWRLKELNKQLEKCKVKTIIIDECQTVKNSAAKRTQAIRDACREIKHVIALSGTPIKNNAAEYFPILNILRPDKFPNEKQFVYGWCDSYYDGFKTKTGGLKDPRRFTEFTKDFIIRRERKEVLPDLPSIFRQFSFCDLGEMVEEMYLQTLKEYQEFYNTSDGMSAVERSANILAFLSKMRHLTGIAKVDPVCDFMEEFITTTDRKMMIFVHHKDVGQMIKKKLDNMAREWPAEWGKGVLELTSDMDAYTRDDQVSKFRSSDHRVLIGSTLASGEGLNLQFCADCIMMERQWNPANEEQAEARFPRPGQLADKINATYFVAVGTVDEFFSELVERKREIVSKTLGGEAVKWDETSLVKELAQTLAEKGGRKWGW